MKYKIEYWPTESLIDYAKNPRKNDHAIDRMAAAIKEFGFRVPILAKSDKLVVDGHLRLKAAKKLSLKEVPVMLADDMSETQIKAFRLSVNRVAEIAEWDLDLLKLELMDLNLEGFDLSLIGFDDDLLANMLKEETEGLTDEDAVPEVPDDPVTVEGDVWVLGKHRLMCGDSTSIDAVEKLMGGVKADMVFTDPPYGIEFTDSKGNGIKNDNLNDENLLSFNKNWQLNADLASKGDCFLMAWQSPRKFYLLDYDRTRLRKYCDVACDHSTLV
jgi:hypothetical protein